MAYSTQLLPKCGRKSTSTGRNATSFTTWQTLQDMAQDKLIRRHQILVDFVSYENFDATRQSSAMTSCTS